MLDLEENLTRQPDNPQLFSERGATVLQDSMAVTTVMPAIVISYLKHKQILQ